MTFLSLQSRSTKIVGCLYPGGKVCHRLTRDQPQPGSFFQRPREAEKRDPGNEVGLPRVPAKMYECLAELSLSWKLERQIVNMLQLKVFYNVSFPEGERCEVIFRDLLKNLWKYLEVKSNA